jgi:hypothetical protein
MSMNTHIQVRKQPEKKKFKIPEVEEPQHFPAAELEVIFKQLKEAFANEVTSP